MDPEFWLGRWQEGRTNFHQDQVMPLLRRHWADLQIPTGSQVLVPLCGKSLDMAWLAAQGYRVLGVELSPLAVQQFFDEHNLTPLTHDSSQGRHYVAGDIEIICGDIFNVTAQTLSNCRGVYDRAALIALPESMRADYVDHVYNQLPEGCKGLLITLDYPQEQMSGPPFSVPDAEIQALFKDRTQAREVERLDILQDEEKFKANGVSSLDTVVYQLYTGQ
ncbi:MAG TPA: thiopurine S-methyltransferase [Pusillimonas sp.]|uniref:thiopurine S-methyltransferase n=1 Tax=unclassified Pusillimonas TaxID=2640016 RepID=UPI002632885E|nr:MULTISPECIES: thiopurine S-methyltransferase [unclassified Pusillimonas]HLU19931.1 thiopurine S-methyltransferase [Pusillimonas sp.]